MNFLSNEEGGGKIGSVRVVHLTESLGGGVLYLLHQLIKAQVDAGLDVTLVHSFRRDTPSAETLDQMFPAPVSRVVLPMATNISLRSDFKSFRDIAELLRGLQPVVIHLHSSKAGALGRAAARSVGLEKTVYYSPHGFSFLRQDVSQVKRAIFLSLEIIGGFFGGKIIASSASERVLANKVVGRLRISTVENCTDVENFSHSIKLPQNRVGVISAGRLCYQKAPWRFWNISASLPSENAEFAWIGDGEMRQLVEEKYSKEKVRIVGWVDRSCLWSELQAADVFVMASLWEGMPLSLIDAQAIGLPAIVSDVVGCRDVVIDGVTGFVCKNDKELVEKTRLLIQDAELRVRMGQAARIMALERFSVKRMHSEMLAAYGV